MQHKQFWWSLFWVGLGGTLGGGARIVIGLWQSSIWATAVINIIGAGLLALCHQLTIRHQLREEWQHFWGTGMLGGFTTFSAMILTLYTVPLDQAIGYLAMTLVGSISVVEMVKRWVTG